MLPVSRPHFWAATWLLVVKLTRGSTTWLWLGPRKYVSIQFIPRTGWGGEWRRGRVREGAGELPETPVWSGSLRKGHTAGPCASQVLRVSQTQGKTFHLQNHCDLLHCGGLESNPQSLLGMSVLQNYDLRQPSSCQGWQNVNSVKENVIFQLTRAFLWDSINVLVNEYAQPVFMSQPKNV